MQAMIEIYKDIEGLNYQISNLGNVKNPKTGRILKPFLNRRGYYRITLMNNGKKEKYYIHRLVAQAFVTNPDSTKFDIVNHKDENPKNCRWDNLEWCDMKYNLNYGTAKERKFNTRMKNQGIDEVYNPNLTDKERNRLKRQRHPDTYEKSKKASREYNRRPDIKAKKAEYWKNYYKRTRLDRLNYMKEIPTKETT